MKFEIGYNNAKNKKSNRVTTVLIWETVCTIAKTAVWALILHDIHKKYETIMNFD